MTQEAKLRSRFEDAASPKRASACTTSATVEMGSVARSFVPNAFLEGGLMISGSMQMAARRRRRAG